MKIIDIHTHIYPDEIARKATDSVRTFYGIGDGTMDGTERMLLEKGAQAGISQFVILPVAIRPDRVQGINNFVLQRAGQRDCFIPFGTVHAAMDGLTDEVERLEKKMETRMQAVEIADDVAKKQLKIVQDIASLLGETAADTLIAIDRLKETISDD